MNKIFVGNIPYNCNNEQFKQLFVNLKGFMSSVIKKYPNHLSSGYGHVVFDNELNAKQLFGSVIIINNKRLRFSLFVNSNNNKIIITNINPELSSSDIYNKFVIYGNIIKYSFIVKNSPYAEITYLSHMSLNSLIQDMNRNILNNNNIGNIMLSSHKKILKFNTQFKNTQSAYQEGVKIGFLLGKL